MYYSKDIKLPNACIYTNQVLMQDILTYCMIWEQMANKCDWYIASNTNEHAHLNPLMDLEYSAFFQLSLPSIKINLIICPAPTREQSFLSNSFVYDVNELRKYLDVMEHSIKATCRERNVFIEPCWYAKYPMHKHICIQNLKFHKLVVNKRWSFFSKDMVKIVKLVGVGFGSFH